MKESSKFIKVALNGDGGDENFAGYRRYKLMKIYEFIKNIPFKLNISSLSRKMYKILGVKDFHLIAKYLRLPYSGYFEFYESLLSFIDDGLKAELYTDEFKNKLKNKSNDQISKLNQETNGNSNTLDRLLSIDINNYLPGVLLPKVDIASMAHSLEVRSPLLDYEFVELCAKIPANLKLKNLTSKYILKKIARKYIPKKCLNRKKQGFLPPLELWFRNTLKENMQDELNERKFISRNIFKPKKINSLINDHIKMESDNTYALWTLMCLKNWLDVWFKN